MVRHASDEDLMRLSLAAAGKALDEVPAADVRAHLDTGCPRCRRRLEQVSILIAAMAEPPLREVPAALLARAAAWLETQESAHAAAPKAARTGTMARNIARAWEEVRATLVFDSAPGALLAGIRGEAATGERQLLYESPSGSVHLRIESGTGGVTALRGQFLPADQTAGFADARVLLSETEHEQTCRLSPTGEFYFDRVREGELRLTLEWASQRVVLDPLALGGTSDA
jgi:hypothetical protein